jgi:hypothetical protein
MDKLTINVLVILVFACGLGLLWYYGKKELVKKIVLNLVIQAENFWGSGTGKIKFAQVMAQIYEKLPWIIRLFVTTNTVTRWIEEAVEYIKTEILAEGNTIEHVLAKQNALY